MEASVRGGTVGRDIRALMARREAAWAVAATVLLALVALWWRWPSVLYDGPATQEAFNDFAFDRFVYTDVVSLYVRDGLAAHPVPYLDYALEYPVGIGAIVYLLGFATSLPWYFWLTWLVMTLAAAGTTLLLGCLSRRRMWLFALAPAVALYVNFNWDMISVLFTVAALVAFDRRRDLLAGGLLAGAVWTKFFPVVMLPILLAARLRGSRRDDAVRLGAAFTAVTVAVNMPLLLARPRAWWHFFGFNAERGGDLNVWTLLVPLDLSPAQMNLAGTAGVLVGVAALVAVVWRAGERAWLPAATAAMAWFFFLNKVYSPQYGVWIVAMLAVLGASTAVAVAWSALDVAYFTTSFVSLGLGQFGDAGGWFVEHVLRPSAVVRLALLLGVVLYAVALVREHVRPGRPADPAGAQPRLRGSPGA